LRYLSVLINANYNPQAQPKNTAPATPAIAEKAEFAAPQLSNIRNRR
jgi:hypothetical protein